jgi:hypothetical protein
MRDVTDRSPSLVHPTLPLFPPAELEHHVGWTSIRGSPKKQYNMIQQQQVHLALRQNQENALATRLNLKKWGK